MAKTKRTSRKRSVRKTKRVSISKVKKPNFNPVIILAVLMVLILAAIYYSTLKPMQTYGNNQQTTTPDATGTASVEGGTCKNNYQCFITYCKGQEKSCVNITQLSGYSENCRTYSDWVTDVQDSSKCACVQNLCGMLK
jgi:hypothetical protein